MSIYILLDYVERCKEFGLEPKLSDLKRYKKKYWRD